METYSLLAITCSKSTIETLSQGIGDDLSEKQKQSGKLYTARTNFLGSFETGGQRFL